MTSYTETIIAVTGCQPSEAPLVEGLMRLDHPTLDGLSCRDFRASALATLEDVRAEPQIAHETAQSFGLI